MTQIIRCTLRLPAELHSALTKIAKEQQISRRELRLMTVVEVGELLGIHKYECVMRWLRDNNVPSYRVNGRRSRCGGYISATGRSICAG